MVDGGSLENCCTATYRGFESLRLREKEWQLVALATGCFGLLATGKLAFPVSTAGNSQVGPSGPTAAFYASQDPWLRDAGEAGIPPHHLRVSVVSGTHSLHPFQVRVPVQNLDRDPQKWAKMRVPFKFLDRDPRLTDS